MTSLYVIVYYDGSMKECIIERCTFSSITPKFVVIKRGMTLQRMSHHRKTAQGSKIKGRNKSLSLPD